MDENGNGYISLEELNKGYKEVSDFKKFMDQMDLTQEDMATVFNALDTGNTQEIQYLDLCQHLGNFFKRDPVIMHSLVKYSVMECRKLLEHDIKEQLHQHSRMLRLLLEDRGLSVAATVPGESQERPAEAEALAADRSELGPIGIGSLSHLSRLSDDLKVLEVELQPLFAKAQEIANSIAAEVAEAREDTIDIDQVALDTKFHDLCTKFEARISDAQQLQKRCKSLLTPIGSLPESINDEQISTVSKSKDRNNPGFTEPA